MRHIHFLQQTSIFVLAFFLVFQLKAKAQVNDLGEFLKTGKNNAEILIKAYLRPLPSGIGGALNTGWVTSASTHETLGFSIQMKGSLAFIPETGRSFDLNKLNLTNVRLANPSNTISPTLGGKDEPGPEVVVEGDGQEVARFNLPQGSGIHFVPAPMVQATIGLIKKTEVIVRYMPEIEIRNYGKFNMLGFGIKHELTQWLPADSFIPIDISVMAGYTKIDLSSKLNLDPLANAHPDPGYTGNYDNQRASISFDTFIAKLIVGKDLPFISVYGAVGYETAVMHAALTGDYPIPVAVSGPAGTEFTRTETVYDPIDFEQKGNNKFSFTGGLKFKLFFFNIYGSYTLAEYSVATAGIGFSFR